MTYGNKIKEQTDIQEFVEKIRHYNRENVMCTDHTFFRLSERQKKEFTCDTIREYLFDKTPTLAGVQYNGCYAVFYKYPKERFIRIIVDIRVNAIYVVTFYAIDKRQLPVIK
jgi:hypothetical protein